MAHSTAGDGRRAAPGRLRPLVRAPRPQQPGRAHPGDTHSGDINRRTAEGAETPGFARAAWGAIEVPFSHREAIALRFRADDAVLAAELVLQTGGGEALGWSATRWRPVLADIERLHRAIVRSNSTAAATRIDVDWRAIATLMRILDDPRPAP